MLLPMKHGFFMFKNPSTVLEKKAKTSIWNDKKVTEFYVMQNTYFSTFQENIHKLFFFLASLMYFKIYITKHISKKKISKGSIFVFHYLITGSSDIFLFWRKLICILVDGKVCS